MISSLALAALAGMVTTFSPCVIPVIPLVIGGSVGAGRAGTAYLLAGLVTSFTLTGTLASLILFKLGLSSHVLTTIGAVGLMAVGFFLLIPQLDHLFKNLTTKTANRMDQTLQTSSVTGAKGQFLIGALIGFIWAPCTGPTLGAAIALAAQGENMLQAALTMFIFSLGACLPLAAYSFLGQKFLGNMQTLVVAGKRLRQILSVLFISIGVAILFNFHKHVEAWILNILPEWWVNFITQF